MDPGLLGRALVEVMRRHEALRIRIMSGPGGRPVATLRAVPETFPLQVVNLSGLPDQAQAAVSAHYGSRDCAVPIDLAHDLPLRATLLTLDDSTHLLVLSLSHLVADGWSCGVLVRELQACYRELRSGDGHWLPVAPPPYSTYVAQREEHYRSGRATRDLDWWLKHLDGMRWSVPLGRGPHSGGAARHSSLTIPFELPHEVAEQLRELASRTQVTSYDLALAAFAASLAHWADTQEILVTVSYAGRDTEEYESVIGLFTNRLPLRIAVDRRQSFTDLVFCVQEVLLDAIDHIDTPFDLVEETLLGEGISVTAQVTIQVYPRAMCDAPAVEEGDLAFQLLGFRTAALHRELALYLVEPDSGPLTGWLTHQTGVMDPSDALRFLTRYTRTLQLALQSPELAVAELLNTSDDVISPWSADSWVTGQAALPHRLPS